MPCQGLIGDYSCPGWRKRAEQIRERDRNRCRGCNRDQETIALEVHHRTYGNPGSCGACYLTAVEDDDLVTLCIECHEAVTNVRRAARYATRIIEVGTISSPVAVSEPVRRAEIVPIELAAPPVAAVVVVRPRQFNPFSKD